MPADSTTADVVKSLEPRNVTLTDFLCFQVGFAFAASVHSWRFDFYVAMYPGFGNIAYWLLFCDFVWVASCALGLGVTLALWSRHLRYDRTLGPGEWLVMVQGGLLLYWAVLIYLQPAQFMSAHGAWHTWLETSPLGWVISTICVIGIPWLALVLGQLTANSCWRKRMQVPLWLLSATLLWSIVLFAESAAFWGPLEFRLEPTIGGQEFTVNLEILPGIPSWLGPGLLLGVPIAVMWNDWKRFGRLPNRVGWAGLSMATIDLTGKPMWSLLLLVKHFKVWWTVLIWQIPTVALVIVGSWLGAKLWRRYVPCAGTTTLRVEPIAPAAAV